MRKFYFFACSLLFSSLTFGQTQVYESFSDGDFTSNPTWTGTTSNWEIVSNSTASSGATGSNTLHLNAAAVDATSYLSTQISGSWGTQQAWGFWLGRRQQAATTTNYNLIWLYANEADITSATVDGYRLLFGDNTVNDEIFLQRVTNGVATTILTSSGAVTNAITDYGFLIRVTRSATGEWNLYTSTLPTANGTGATADQKPTEANTNILQGTVTDNTYTALDNGYISLAAVHTSGASAIIGYEYDQIVFSPTGAIVLPAKLSKVKATQNNNITTIEFTNETEKDVVSYNIEKAIEGGSFTSIKELQPSKNNGEKVSYKITDNSATGTILYRIKIIENTGKTTYSSILRVDSKNRNPSLLVAPNPIKGKDLSIQVSNLIKGNYILKIFGMNGQVISQKSMQFEEGTATYSLPLNNIKAGMYYIEISGAVKMQKQFIVQ